MGGGWRSEQSGLLSTSNIVVAVLGFVDVVHRRQEETLNVVDVVDVADVAEWPGRTADIVVAVVDRKRER